LTDAAAAAGLQDDERGWLESLAAEDRDNALVRVELSRLLAATGNAEAAAAAAAEAMRLGAGEARGGRTLASVYADGGDAEQLAALAEALIAGFPLRSKPRYYRANALLLKGRPDEAA